jgi:hypothetical protein
MFTYADGRPIRPESLTHRFSELVKALGLPPIRLHDLPHGAATLALASHTDLKVIQQMLGHSSIVTTLSVVAGAAILVTGRYPRGIFEFNVGVLRWTWRVQYYAIGAFATDRYTPFSLEDDPGYPAHFDVEYPEQLSRGLVLVKWWLLAIPHYLIVALFIGGTWAAYHFGGLVSVLTVIAGVIVLFTGSYPRSVYDFVLGMNRWVLRVAAYASLMTDEYPPFRLDMGGTEGWPEPQDLPA